MLLFCCSVDGMAVVSEVSSVASPGVFLQLIIRNGRIKSRSSRLFNLFINDVFVKTQLEMTHFLGNNQISSC